MDSIPSPNQVRGAIPASMRASSVLRALWRMLPSLALYLGLWFACVALPWWTWPLLVPLLGVAEGILFVVGHDGAHQSLTPYRTLNAWIARVLFVPAWHAYAGWVHAHNHSHHGWTNFQPKDYVWAPMSLAEYRSLPRWRQALVRLYRWWPGFGLYYFVEVLVKRQLRLQPEVRRWKLRLAWIFDDAFLVLACVAQAWAAVALAARLGVRTHPAALVVATQVAPALVANYLIGLLTYLHHTHPQIPWFQSMDEWNFYRGHVLGTTHTKFGYGIGGAIHHVMEHTAHHVDPRIPLYHLPDAQKSLLAMFPVVKHIFTWRTFTYVQRTCQLYDFQRHCWLRFDGETASSQTIDVESLRGAVSQSKPAAADQAAAV